MVEAAEVVAAGVEVDSPIRMQLLWAAAAAGKPLWSGPNGDFFL